MPLRYVLQFGLAEVLHVQIQDAKLHYHERTDELYYVIAGAMIIPLCRSTPGLRRGIQHQGQGVMNTPIGRFRVKRGRSAIFFGE